MSDHVKTLKRLYERGWPTAQNHFKHAEWEAIGALLAEREPLVVAADGYAGDLRAIVNHMNRLGYPHHPEYPDDSEIIRRLGEMASEFHRVKEENERLRAALASHESTLEDVAKERDDVQAKIDAALALHRLAPEPMQPEGSGRICGCGNVWANGYCTSPTVQALKGEPPETTEEKP